MVPPIELAGDVLCPDCGYEGQDYDTKKGIFVQRALECPECGRWV